MPDSRGTGWETLYGVRAMPRRGGHRVEWRGEQAVCRVLALAGGENLPQDDFGDLRALDVGALERLLDRDLPQFVRRQRRKCPVESADRRAGRSDDDDIVLHLVTPFRVRLDGDGTG